MKSGPSDGMLKLKFQKPKKEDLNANVEIQEESKADLVWKGVQQILNTRKQHIQP
jgi:hypothetical protein